MDAERAHRLTVTLFRWFAIGDAILALGKAGKLYRGHKILRIYKKAYDQYVEARASYDADI